MTKINVSLLDLKKAYLQIKIDKSLWLYQAVIFKGEGISYPTCGPKEKFETASLFCSNLLVILTSNRIF